MKMEVNGSAVLMDEGLKICFCIDKTNSLIVFVCLYRFQIESIFAFESKTNNY